MNPFVPEAPAVALVVDSVGWLIRLNRSVPPAALLVLSSGLVTLPKRPPEVSEPDVPHEGGVAAAVAEAGAVELETVVVKGF